jgi:hypothetical protein
VAEPKISLVCSNHDLRLNLASICYLAPFPFEVVEVGKGRDMLTCSAIRIVSISEILAADFLQRTERARDEDAKLFNVNGENFGVSGEYLGSMASGATSSSLAGRGPLQMRNENIDPS